MGDGRYFRTIAISRAGEETLRREERTHGLLRSGTDRVLGNSGGKMILALIIVGWLICAVLTAGMSFAYFEEKYPIAKNDIGSRRDEVVVTFAPKTVI